MTHLWYILFILVISMQHTNSAKILNISPFWSKSHHLIHTTITKNLASKGHQIITINHFNTNQNLPNYTELPLSEKSHNFIDSIKIEETDKLNEFWRTIFRKQDMETAACHSVFNLNHIREMVHSNDKIDLIIAEVLDSSCYYILAHVFDAPIILISAPCLRPALDYFLGNPHNPSYTPLLGIPFTTRMSFWERLQNTILFSTIYWYRIYMYNNENKNMAKRYFNIDLPSQENLLKRTALVLYNNHPSFLSRPKSPGAIDIAGIHIEAAKKLPKDLEEFITYSTHGVILFSFGTTIKASSMSAEKIKTFIEVFSMIPQRILWRVDDLNAFDVPPNVKLTKWLPQRDILEYPNVVAFISHGGLLSTLEAIHTGTPVITIPFWFDQFQNGKILVEKGVGLYMDYHNMDQGTLLSAIAEILLPKYKENMEKYSRIFKDRPMSPVKEAMYWIEYVLKHRESPRSGTQIADIPFHKRHGVHHLRTSAADMPLHEYLLMDVIIFIFIVIACALYFFRLALKFLLYLL